MYDEVWIRDVRDGDLDAFFEHQRDPEANRMAASTPMTRPLFLIHWAELRADPAVVVQTVVVNGEVAGSLTCWRQWGERQVGYWIGRPHWGRGVATTALALFLCRVTSRPLHAYAAAGNAGSRRVLEKCGFEPVPAGGQDALAAYVLNA